ncbi:helix-turn-helix transcriptional regulator [Photobacterium sp. J15]|uniref:helix-turn-helix transcriptional regulator n=1 Tax=Photobacterium sp. J15 TaxID=265901 RepID=UPI0007E34F30|nr:AlpA family phage regulatory protein [Photobacterium sp. J15]
MNTELVSNDMAQVSNSSDRFVREKERQQITQISRSTAWRLEQEGKFPARRQIGGRAVGWLHSELMDWVNNQPKVGA